MVSAKKAYELIILDFLPPPSRCIISQIWNFNIPQKLKCFTWLDFFNKINTWDKLCNRGWLGPNRCFLCKKEVESIDHLFVGCSFALEVMHFFDSFIDIHMDCSEPTLTGNLISWFEKDRKLSYLPIFFIWNLWKTRNNHIF